MAVAEWHVLLASLFDRTEGTILLFLLFRSPFLARSFGFSCCHCLKLSSPYSYTFFFSLTNTQLGALISCLHMYILSSFCSSCWWPVSRMICVNFVIFPLIDWLIIAQLQSIAPLVGSLHSLDFGLNLTNFIATSSKSSHGLCDYLINATWHRVN